MELLEREVNLFFADKERALTESMGALAGKLATSLDLVGFEDNITNFLRNSDFYARRRTARAGHVEPVPATDPKAAKRVRQELASRHVSAYNTASERHEKK